MQDHQDTSLVALPFFGRIPSLLQQQERIAAEKIIFIFVGNAQENYNERLRKFRLSIRFQNFRY